MKENIICTDKYILKMLNSRNESDNDKGLDCLYKICSRSIKKFILDNNGNEDDAMDVIQDSIIIFYEQIKNNNLTLECSVSTYLYSVSRNLWLRKIKFNGRFTNDLSEYIYIDESITGEFDDDLREKEFLKLFNELAERCRDILIYFYYDKISMKDIMNKMNFKSEQSAKNKKHKCLNYLKDIVLKNKDFKKYI